MNLLKRLLHKPVVLRLYTDRPEVVQQAKMAKAAQVYPSWWRKLPLEIQYENKLGWSSTMKRCAGFTELYQHGYMLPLWTDLAIEIGAVGNDTARWNFADSTTQGISHPQVQRGEYMPATQYFHFKLTCPWRAFCDEDIKWVFMQPTWNFDKPEELLVPPAIVDFKYQHGLQVNTFFVRKNAPVVYRLHHGQSLVHLVPITDRPVVVEHHLVTTQELDQMDPTKPSRFTKTYKHNKEAGACPFHK